MAARRHHDRQAGDEEQLDRGWGRGYRHGTVESTSASRLRLWLGRSSSSGRHSHAPSSPILGARGMTAKQLKQEAECKIMVARRGIDERKEKAGMEASSVSTSHLPTPS
ncbi:hypothetical protein PMAYCL1PPCAC_21416, partial [Pristionchus mayeri]